MAELPERESKLVPALVHYTLWLRRWRCTSPHAHTGGRGLLMLIETSTGGTLLLWAGLQCLLRRSRLPPDPEPLDPGVPELNIIEGLSLRMTQAINHYQHEECHWFVCGATDHFAWDCPHRQAFHIWHKEHLNSKGVGPQHKEPAPKSPSQK